MRVQLMKCPHGRTARHGCPSCNPPQVTETGRAISPGRVTRASLSVKRPGGKPLPMDKQCHPKALVKTSLHPGCFSGGQPHWGYGLFGLPWTRDQMEEGQGLNPEGRYSVVRTTNEQILGYTDDITLAMAYKVRAAARALYLEVIDNAA